MTGLWHRAYVLEDVDTARAIIAEHRRDPQRVDRCGSGTHLYRCEWPCPRWVWATDVLHAHERGEILTSAEALAASQASEEAVR